MSVFVVITLSPFGPMAVISIIFWPSLMLIVVEKSPFWEGVIIS